MTASAGLRPSFYRFLDDSMSVSDLIPDSHTCSFQEQIADAKIEERLCHRCRASGGADGGCTCFIQFGIR